MKFSQAVTKAGLLETAGPDNDVRAIQYDSRRIAPGDCFLAMRGESVNGNRFIANAVAAGASAIVTDSPEAFRANTVANPYVALGLCTQGREALARIASNLLGHPEQTLSVTGVTGTNGKTTTTWLIEAMLGAALRKTVLVGTIAYRVAGGEVAAPHTTPESSDLLSLFAQGVAAGATEAVMEVSSHALEQRRVWGVPFDVAVFTNFTRDHLDFHGSMEYYFAAKKKLFEPGGTGEGAPRVSILWAEDPAVAELAAELVAQGRRVETFGLEHGDWRSSDVLMTAAGTDFLLASPLGAAQVRTSLVGRVNVLNTLAALAAATARGASLQQAVAGAAQLAYVPGRFQRVRGDQPFTVVVDYAHTDDALRNLTQLARELVAGNGRVITLFGCGGDRDRTKRPRMAAAAAENSDFIILTSDNPRSEDPRAILQDAEVGFALSTTPYKIIEDRAEAIRAAIAEARAGDIVLLAGKGHEKTQTLATGTIPFDDVMVAEEALRVLRAGAAQ